MTKIKSFDDLKLLMDQMPEETAVSGGNHLSETEQEEIKQQLLRQIEDEEDDGGDFTFITFLSQPEENTDNQSLVEIEYLGHLAYVDISFQEIDISSQQDYDELVSFVKVIADQENKKQVKNAVKELEKYGDKVIEVIYREADLFDLSNQEILYTVSGLLSRLSLRSLDGRRLTKAIIERAGSDQHIKLAILTAGQIEDRETVNGLLRHLRNPDLFEFAFEALLSIRDQNSVKTILEIIDGLDVNNEPLIDQAKKMARRFHVFGTDAILSVYDAYIHNEKFKIRPIFSHMLQSFGDDAVPVLLEMLEKEDDVNKLNRICLTMGSIDHPFAQRTLIEAFHKFPEKKSCIIRGLSHSKDKEMAPIFLEMLQASHDFHIQKECIHGLSFVGNRKEHGPILQKYLNSQSPLYMDALFCLVRLGDNAQFEKFVELLTEGDAHQQFIIEKFTNRLQVSMKIKLAERILTLREEKAIHIVTALQGPSFLPREIGPILEEKLKTAENSTFRLEIYRLISKHVNNKDKSRDLCSDSILYDAFEQEKSPMIKRELDQIIKKMKTHVSPLRQASN